MTHTTVAVLGTTTQILEPVSHRNLLLIQNDSTSDIYLSMDGTDAELNKGIRLNANGGSLLLTQNLPPGAINAIHGAGAEVEKELLISYL